MRDRALFSLAVFAAVGALGVTGCGGDDETSSTASTPTADQWATQADAICAQGDKDQQAAVTSFFQQAGISPNQQPTGAQFQQLATQVIIPSIEQQINAIKALPAPEDEADQVSEFLDQAESDLDKLKDDPSQITNDNSFAETQTLAADLGLKTCASNS